jgi:hypothetical protein
MKFEVPSRQKPQVSVLIDGVRIDNIGYDGLSINSNTDGTGSVDLTGCDTLLELRGHLNCQVEIALPEMGVVEMHTGMLCYPTENGYHFRTTWRRKPLGT